MFYYRIAQLNVVQLTNDLTAAALAYGYFQKNLPAAPLQANDARNGVGPSQGLRQSAPPISEQSRLVVFVDFGHSGLQTGNFWIYCGSFTRPIEEADFATCLCVFENEILFFFF
jgi:hypothetical protein